MVHRKYTWRNGKRYGSYLYEMPRERAGGIILGGNYIFENVGFVPNITFDAVRGWNNLTVYADEIGPPWRFDEDNVTFYVHVNNSAPVFENFDSEMFVCEGSSQEGGFLDIEINATDIDETDLDFGITPSNGYGLFYISRGVQDIVPGLTTTFARFYSANLYDSPGSYWLNISVFENEEEMPLSETLETALADRKEIRLDVIEMNSLPNITNEIGVQTVWTRGENSTLYNDFDAVDSESVALFFNVSFEPDSDLFVITQDGMIDYTGQVEDIGNYVVNVCVIDEGLESPHQNISDFCGQNGLNNTVCNLFELTVTDENRAPEIVDYFPAELEFNVAGKSEIYFNVTEYDADGTNPDAYWYIDDVLIEFDSLSLVDEFFYTFDCGVSGEHYIKVDITDGELSASLQWKVTVDEVICPKEQSGQGGGGGCGGSVAKCEVLWGCDNWRQCRNIEESLTSGTLSGEIY